jgi:hypothetical protein
LIKRSSHEEDRPALFAAQFALSHACWLLTYPLAGWMGAAFGMSWTFLALAAIASTGTAAAFLLWPVNDPGVVPHIHKDLPPDHPHVRDARQTGDGLTHAHTLVIDKHHRHWPGEVQPHVG